MILKIHEDCLQFCFTVFIFLLALLVSCIHHISIFPQIEVTKTYGVSEWREDVKRVLMKAGGDGKPTVFLLTDTQVKDESFIEDINTILNTGDLPNLYTNEEKAEILEKMQTVAKDEVMFHIFFGLLYSTYYHSSWVYMIYCT